MIREQVVTSFAFALLAVAWGAVFVRTAVAYLRCPPVDSPAMREPAVSLSGVEILGLALLVQVAFLGCFCGGLLLARLLWVLA